MRVTGVLVWSVLWMVGLLALTASGLGASLHTMSACLDPPCGFVTPLVDLDFPDKPDCPGYLDIDATKCIPLPQDHASFVVEGTLRWWWDATQEGTYPNDPDVPVVIRFEGSTVNPSFLAVAVEPESFTLGTADILDPRNFVTDTSDPLNPVVLFEYKRPIKVTITRDGDPSEADLDRSAMAGDVVKLFLKAKSNASSDRIRQGFGTEEFRFDGSQAAAEEDSRGAAAAGPMLSLATLGLAGLGLRRRLSKPPSGDSP